MELYLRQLVGRRGQKSQSTMHAIHKATGTMFFAEINKCAITCWNSKTMKQLRASSMGEVARDNITLIYPSDLDVREELALVGCRKEGNLE